ncbi:MAG: hypothetical protein JNM30_14250 [Rhodospirillales bacterium]|nr:hypothetical protein [Rhodospirillales bacterium]
MTPPRSRRREALLALASVAVTLAMFLGAAEIVLRFLPVATGMHTMPVTPEQPVMHFAPDREFLFSRDWDLALVNRGRTNNAGFVNDQAYRRDDTLPLLGVIGDSYVHAAMVPYPETLQGRLAAALAGKRRVYSFGASGAPLSQYLVWARVAVDDYGADRLVIVVVGNDFDESHVRYKSGPGFWLYAPGADGALALTLQEYRPGRLRDVAYHSALARYLLFNLGVGPQLFQAGIAGRLMGPPAGQGQGQAGPPIYAGNTDTATDEARMAASQAVIAAFFRDLPAYARLAPGRVLFVLDGFRYPQAAEASRGTYFDRMRRLFVDRATAQGYATVDMDGPFFARHRQTGERFEWPRDGHWNPLGHELAAKAVLESPLLKD